MAYTKEQLDSLNKINQQFQTKYGDNAQNEFQNYVTENYGADKLQEIKNNLSGNVTQQKVDNTFTQNKNRQKELEGLIKSGQGSASVNAEYNRLTGNNQGARDVMLGSTEAQKTMKTTITPEEAGQIVQSGVTDIGEGVKPDMTAGTKEDFKQAMQPTEKQTPTTTTDITYNEDKTPYDANKVISKAPQFTGSDGKTYQTVRNSDNTLTTIDVTTGQPVTGKYTDAERDSIKQSFLRVDQATITHDMIYQSLLLGQSVDKNTPGYNDAKKRYDAYNMYSTMTDAQLSASIGKGNILPGTTVYEDLMKDPLQKARIEKIQKYNLITGNTPKTEDVFTNKSEEIANNTKVNIEGQDMTLAQAIDDGYISENEINSLTNNSEIITKAKEVENLKNEYDSALAIYNNIERDIKEQWKGTGATKTDIAVAVANAREKLLPGLQELESRTNNAIGTLTQMKADSAQLFATNLGLYQQQQQREQQLQDIQQQREYQTAQDVKNFEQQKEIMKLQQDYQNANIQTDIIQVGNKNVLINTKTGETIKSFDMPTEPMKPESLIKMGEDSIYDPNTRTWITTPKIGNVTPGTTQNRPDRNNNPGNLKAGDVGYGVDDQNHTIFGSAEEGYQAMVRDITAKMTGNTRTGLGPNSTLAQLGKVYAEDPNWAKAVSKLSGYTLDTKLSQIDVNRLAPAIAKQEGFTGSINAGGQPTGKQYSDEQISDLAYVTELLEKTPTEGRKALKEMGYTDKDIANYKAGNIPLTEKQKNSSFEVVNGIQDLISNYDWNDAVGKFDYSRVLGLQGAEDAKIAIDNLVAKLTLPNLGVLKGPMSDKDIEFIKAASSKLGTTQSNKSFEKNLIDAYNIAARRAGIKEVKTLNEIKTGTSNTNTTGTSTQYGGKVYNFKP